MCFSSGSQKVSKPDVSLVCIRETYCVSASLIAIVVFLGSASVLGGLLDHLRSKLLLVGLAQPLTSNAPSHFIYYLTGTVGIELASTVQDLSEYRL